MPHVAPWFPNAKFGVFLHWLLNYPREPQTNKLPRDFRELLRQQARDFTAQRYDPWRWARMFKSWGARYAVLTTKHHMGFALFDCPQSPFTSARHSAAKRDLVRDYAEALREEGIKVGFYYSLPDWYHPDYASIAGRPGADRFKYARTTDSRRWERFVRHMFDEVRHLCTAYGKVDLLWFDGDWERTAKQWHSEELAAMVERLQPGIVLNNRLRHPWIGHYGTPEQRVPLASPDRPWEVCMTVGRTWEYEPGRQGEAKPLHELVRIFGDIAGMGGNLLLNLGVKPDGSLQRWETTRMAGLGRWIQRHKEGIFGTQPGLPPSNFGGNCTRRGSVLYLTVYDQPRPELLVKGVLSPVARVTHVATGRRLSWRTFDAGPAYRTPRWLFIRIPPTLMEEAATMVRVEFKDDVCEFETAAGRVKWLGREQD